jgi:hypothetical protein
VSFQHAIRRAHAAGASVRELAAALAISHQRVHQIVDASSGKGVLKRARAESTCSFCTARVAPRLAVAGPAVHICAACAGLGRRLLEGEALRPASGGVTSPLGLDRGTGRCSFCDRPATSAQPLAHAPKGVAPPGRRPRRRRSGVRICGECLALACEILEVPAEQLDQSALATSDAGMAAPYRGEAVVRTA